MVLPLALAQHEQASADRAIAAPKFDKVLELFDAHLAPAGVGTWTRPKGGYFITLDVPDGCARRRSATA